MKKLVVFVSIVCLCCFFYKPKENKQMQQLLDLTISNIESIAQNETGAHAICVGTGSLDCKGYKVKTIYSNYR